eukprot:Opistho-2@43145
MQPHVPPRITPHHSGEHSRSNPTLACSRLQHTTRTQRMGFATTTPPTWWKEGKKNTGNKCGHATQRPRHNTHLWSKGRDKSRRRAQSLSNTAHQQRLPTELLVHSRRTQHSIYGRNSRQEIANERQRERADKDLIINGAGQNGKASYTAALRLAVSSFDLYWRPLLSLHMRSASLKFWQKEMSLLALCTHCMNCCISYPQGPPCACCCWYGCCWYEAGAAAAGAAASSDLLPLNMLVRPAPSVWPTADPTATPAAVVAICANIPGCCGCCIMGAGGCDWCIAGAGAGAGADRGAAGRAAGAGAERRVLRAMFASCV